MTSQGGGEKRKELLIKLVGGYHIANIGIKNSVQEVLDEVKRAIEAGFSSSVPFWGQ